MANHDHSTRRLRPSSSTETPPPRRATSPDQKISLIGAFPLVDLDAHPDAALLKACSIATKLRDACEAKGINPNYWPVTDLQAKDLWRLTHFITETEALTSTGVTMKALFVLGDTDDLAMYPAGTAPMASVIRDFLRMGVPA